MFPRSKDFIDLANKKVPPSVLVYIVTATGIRVYGYRYPSDKDIGNIKSVRLYDGSIKFDGTNFYGFGTENILERDGEVLSIGIWTENLVPETGQLLSSLRQTELSSTTIVLNNADRSISKILSKDPWLGAEVIIKVGFKDLANADYITRARGLIDQITLRSTEVQLRVVGI
jgi:hypothetical protein